LLDPSCISFDSVGLRIGRDLDANAVGLRTLSHHDEPLLECLSHRERGARELHLARFDLGQVEHVVDEREQMAARREDVFEVLRLLLVHGAEHLLAEDLREPQDRVQRRAQLVRHVREELRLVPAGRLELAYRRLSSSFMRLTFAASAPSSSRFTTSTCPRSRPRRSQPGGRRSAGSSRSSDHERMNPEHQRQHQRRDRDPDEEVPRAHVGPGVAGDQVVDLRGRAVGEIGGVLVQVDGESFGSLAESNHVAAQRIRLVGPG
jgi:hypothetical protein